MTLRNQRFYSLCSFVLLHLVVLLGFALAASAQNGENQVTPDDRLRHFSWLLDHIGHPNTPPALQEVYRNGVIRHFRLNATESRALLTVADQYKADAFKIAAQVKQYLASTAQTGTRSSLVIQGFRSQKDALVSLYTDALLRQVGPSAAARLMEPLNQLAQRTGKGKP